jgi:formyltetrahydrofolate synthetase
MLEQSTNESNNSPCATTNEIDEGQFEEITPNPDVIGAINTFREAIKIEKEKISKSLLVTAKSLKGTNNYKQGRLNAVVARKEMEAIFKDHTNKLYFAKDIDLAKKYDVTKLTIYKIRDNLQIPSRSKRILNLLKEIATSEYTVQKLSEDLGLKYCNLYNIMKNNKLPFKEM